MNWSNVRLICFRELRDQLRDRRTIFTIAILPMLLYPLLGMSILQITQFTRETPSKVWILGTAALPERPKLLNSTSTNFADDLVVAHTAQLLQLHIEPAASSPATADEISKVAESHIRHGKYNAVIYFPSDFGEQLEKFRHSLRESTSQELNNDGNVSKSSDFKTSSIKLPEPELFVDTASDESRIAASRVENVLRAWRDRIVQDNLRDSRIPANVTTPFQVSSKDIAKEVRRQAAFWSKILPFIVLIWALTGAFYPAVDLCAGEKERGTLETLLSSPAARREIVWGKLLTTMCFSIGTSILNLASMGATGAFISSQMQRIGGGSGLGLSQPPVHALAWLIVAIIPISAMFSALSLAVAAFAKSSKEGQYYLMPLLLVALPLMILPVLPATELTLGTSLIPVTGVMLLLRSLIEGHYLLGLRFALPAAGVTAVCCLLAIRWAVDQFSNESVLFRETERFELSSWLRHLVRDRPETPYVSSAILCGVLLLIAHFVASLAARAPQNWSQFAVATLLNLLCLIALPAIVMALLLSRNPTKTLLLTAPKPVAIPMAGLLAVCLHPLGMEVTRAIAWLYPIGNEVASQLQAIEKLIGSAPNLISILGLIALAPAICEELAFRGFILSGLKRSGDTWLAILVSSVFFGATHGLLQQSMSATLLGLVLGFVAVRSGSLFPGMLFHFVYNSLGVMLAVIGGSLTDSWSWLNLLFVSDAASGAHYRPIIVALGVGFATMLMIWFQRLAHSSSSSESRPGPGTLGEKLLIGPSSDTVLESAWAGRNLTA